MPSESSFSCTGADWRRAFILISDGLANQGDSSHEGLMRRAGRGEVKALRAEIEQRAAEGQALAERLEQQQAQFESLRTRVRAEIARGLETAESHPWLGEPVVADEEVELELRRRRRGAEGGR